MRIIADKGTRTGPFTFSILQGHRGSHRTRSGALETAENLLLFSADIGQVMQKIEKAQGFASSIPDVNVKNVKTKTETIHDMGFTDRQARDFQTLAKHEETVQKAIRKWVGRILHNH